MSGRNDRSVSFESGGIAIWLIRHAASQVPDCFTSRLEEEWLADIGSRSRPCRDWASGLSTTLSHTRGLGTSLNPPIPPIAETLHLSKKELP